VAAKNTGTNTLVVGGEESLCSASCNVKRINLIACENIFQPRRLTVKTRYLQKEQWATVEQTGPDTIRVDFEEPQRAITPGQAAVFYDGDTVVGGGTIAV
jgi:tRNA-specific 2-thiouridylase